MVSTNGEADGERGETRERREERGKEAVKLIFWFMIAIK